MYIRIKEAAKKGFGMVSYNVGASVRTNIGIGTDMDANGSISIDTSIMLTLGLVRILVLIGI